MQNRNFERLCRNAKVSEYWLSGKLLEGIRAFKVEGRGFNKSQVGIAEPRTPSETELVATVFRFDDWKVFCSKFLGCC